MEILETSIQLAFLRVSQFNSTGEPADHGKLGGQRQMRDGGRRGNRDHMEEEDDRFAAARQRGLFDDSDKYFEDEGRHRSRGDDQGDSSTYGGQRGESRYTASAAGGSFRQQQQPIKEDRITCCDCEIVCISKNQRHYAESIEIRLRNLGMEVDVLFPNPEIPLAKILSNISSRGVAFAILVTPMHEEHRSITVNIMQGQQQEHRNMPLDDAISLVAKSFEHNLGVKGDDSIPKDVTAVLGFLSENRPLSVMEYDTLIKYLAQRRERMLKTEYGENVPAHLVSPPTGPAQDPAMRIREEQLKTKIMGILNKPKESTPMPAINSSLQRAIDSLIKSGPNLLLQPGPVHYGGSPFGSMLGSAMVGAHAPPAQTNQQHQQSFSGYGGGSF